MRKPAASPSPHEHVVGDEWHSVAVRRAPRIGRFLWLGIAAGAALAAICTWLAIASREGATAAGFGGVLLTFVIFALAFIGAGLLVMGCAALALDRVARRRTHKSTADHETVLFYDLSRPTNDDPPRREP